MSYFLRNFYLLTPFEDVRIVVLNLSKGAKKW